MAGTDAGYSYPTWPLMGDSVRAPGALCRWLDIRLSSRSPRFNLTTACWRILWCCVVAVVAVRNLIAEFEINAFAHHACTYLLSLRADGIQVVAGHLGAAEPGGECPLPRRIRAERWCCSPRRCILRACAYYRAITYLAKRRCERVDESSH